ncbi:DUF4233 domain-containing protein [Janibacter melonis]|uniref:DUF4233 domain-containing protein n=1 Tax=Janibacter melonis TaxID=262209 RepID=UPI0020439E53|nr:DUF4233 domain-containing protein [Janibacter melonis]MCM3554023.1 DUF4233 domain-containing protein [Janibacter melonis]
MSTIDGPRRPGAIASGRFTWRMLATVLGGQSVVIFLGALVARGFAGNDSSATPFVVMCVLAVACAVAAGLVRRPGGVAIGWAVQLATVLCGFLVTSMFFVGLIFGALWLLCLRVGRRVDAEDAERARAAGGA